MFSECYDEAERAVRAARSTTPAGAASSVGFAAASSAALAAALPARRAAPPPRPTAVAALDLRNDVARRAGLSRVRAEHDRLRRARPRHRRPGAAGAGRRLLRHPAVRGPAVQPGDARARLAAGRAGRPRGRARGAAGVRRARAARWGVGTPQIIAWRSSAAEVCLRLGRLEQARSLAAEEVALARSIGAPRALGVALRAAALAESGARRIELLREAVASLEASQGALELARARIDLGAALVRAGQRDEARGLLRAGQEGAARLRCDAAGRARAPRAAGHRRAAAADRGGRARRAHAERAARDRDGRRRADQPRDRAGAVRDREDGRDAPRARVHEARRALAQAARAGAGPRAGRGGLTPARVTLATVAEALGVSTMTVSNAYNRPEKLSAELRERILAKADELGYAGPNALARSLRRGRTGVLGVVLGEALTYAFEDPATVEFFRGLGARPGSRCSSCPRPAAEGDAALVLRRGGRRLRPVRAARRAPAGRGGAAAAAADRRAERAASWRATRSWRSTSARRPRPPRSTCARSATRGWRCSALPFSLAGRADRPLRAERARAPRHARAARGLRRRAPAARSQYNDRAHGEAAAGALLDGAEPPTGLLCMSDELAIGALQAAARARARRCRASSRWSAGTTRRRPRAPTRR